MNRSVMGILAWNIDFVITDTWDDVLSWNRLTTFLWITFLNSSIMTVDERRRRRFSESFRKEQVALIEAGKTSVGEVSRFYEVKRQNVRAWLDKYGSQPLQQQVIITNSNEYNRLGAMEKEIKRLKELIGEQQVKIVTQQALIKLAEEKLGNDFEKK
ncbi:MAG: transposase [Bacteroidia bacterium]|nr:transposase [Bacteroidia bacterium]